MIQVLTTIGIIAGALVLFGILVLVLLLFAPVKLELAVKGRYPDIKVHGNARWLSGLLSAFMYFQDGDICYGLKAAGIKLRTGTIRNISGAINDVSPFKSDKNVSQDSEEVFEEQNRKSGTAGQSDEKALEEESSEFTSFEKKVRTLVINIRNLISKGSEVINVLSSSQGKNAMRILKKNTLILIKKMKPFIIKGYIRYGLEDAASTAVLYGILGHAAYLISEDGLAVIPDFMDKGFEADVNVRAGVRLIAVVIMLMNIFPEEDIKKTFDELRRIVNV